MNDTELRIKARLAWNGWPDTPDSRRIIAEHEARDKVSAEAWDRVIAAVNAPSMAVKDLRWEECPALGGGRKLIARDCFGHEFRRIDLPIRDLEAHKAAAQTDYEKYIASALIHAPQDDVRRVAGSPLSDWVLRKNGYFYRQNAQGYTASLAEAGRYTEEEAREHRIRSKEVTMHLASEFVGPDQCPHGMPKANRCSICNPY